MSEHLNALQVVTEGTTSREEEVYRLPWPEFTTDATVDPIAHPEAFSQFVSDSLASVGIEDPYNVIMAGIDGSVLEKTKTFGDRKSTFALWGNQLRLDAQQAEYEGHWPQHSTVAYAMHFHPDPTPMIIVFDRGKMQSKVDAHEEWSPKDGNMDDHVVAVFRLTVSHKN